MYLRSILAVSLLFLSANCAPEEDSFLNEEYEDQLVDMSNSGRWDRARLIRDTAAAAGLTNGVLLAGIGRVETNFAHCWSEATWACQGPASASCGGGPVIAGSADGPCRIRQGGLGMFQFDAGTHSQTIARYGQDIVTLEGNTDEVVPFLTQRAVESVPGIHSEQEALDWMNNIPIVDGDPEFEKWLYFVSWRYNGCKGCRRQQNKYRVATHRSLREFGADFWEPAPPEGCAPIAKVGSLLEESDACVEPLGPQRYWRAVDSGHGGTLLWTKTTSSSNPANYAVWHITVEESGFYYLRPYSDGGLYGMSTQASYEVSHAEGKDRVVLDQSSIDGFGNLGRFYFEAGEHYRVRLNDNTGEAWAADPGGTKLLVDALLVAPSL